MRRLFVLAALVIALLGLAPAAEAQQFGGTTYCNSSVVFDATPSVAATRLVTGSTAGTGGSIYICGYVFTSNSTVTVDLVYGTGTACATGTVAITPAYQIKSSTSGLGGIADVASNWRGLDVLPANDLCINVSPTGQSVQAIVYFYQQR